MTLRTVKRNEVERRNVYVSMVDADLVAAFRRKCEESDKDPTLVLARILRKWIAEKQTEET